MDLFGATPGQGVWSSDLDKEGQAEAERALGLADATVEGLGASGGKRQGVGLSSRGAGPPCLPHTCAAGLSLIHSANIYLAPAGQLAGG